MKDSLNSLPTKLFHPDSANLLKKQILAIREDLKNKDMQLYGKDLRLRELQERLNLVYGSFSWRITAPLRLIGDWLCRRTGVNIAANQGGIADHEVAYTEWVSQYDTLSSEDFQAISHNISNFTYKPLISIIMPVYNTPEKWLRLAIESVRAQLYPCWEICIADDASTAPHIRPLLEEYQRLDARIKVAYRRENGHISAASNSALELATGEFIALLDHDDELAPHALYMVVHELNQCPDYDILYSDEDKLDLEGNRFNPFFKSDWSPDLFFAQNYVSHLGVYRSALVRQVGGFRIGYEGSQDYDLCLRCSANSSPERIRHIPAILYHWRSIEGSTAYAEDEKGYAEVAARRALLDHFSGVNPAIKVEAGSRPTTYVVTYPLPSKLPLVSLIIPTRDGYSILRKCVESILNKTDYPNFELVIVDNQSSDGRTLRYLEHLRRNARVCVVSYDAPFNYSAINNYAVSQVKGEIIGLINNNLEVISPNWLTEMVRHAVRPEIGAVGAKLYYPDNRIQHAGVVLGIRGGGGHAHLGSARGESGKDCRLLLVQNFSAVTAACLVIRKEILEQVSGLDEESFAIAFNDVDFCLRVREAGYRNLWTPKAELYHHESFSRGYENTLAKQQRFNREIECLHQRWGALLYSDSYYSPNLTLDYPDYGLAWPPRVMKPWKMKKSDHE